MNTTSSSSPAFRQKRRFYTVLPILICPLLLLFFWLLGGGTAVAADTGHTRSVGGLNLSLPAAKLKDDSRLTKMDYYRKADQDSAKHRQLAKSDPYYRLSGATDQDRSIPTLAKESAITKPFTGKAFSSAALPRLHDSDRNEALVYRKLAVLNATLAQKAPTAPPPTLPPSPTPSTTSDVAHLERLVQSLHNRDTAIDPDLRELSTMLDKIVAIQHPSPSSVANTVNEMSDISEMAVIPEKSVVTLPTDTVRAVPTVVENLPDSNTDDQNGFYESSDAPVPSPATGSIPAVVDETVTIVNSASVPFRLLQDIHIKTSLIPAGSLVYGAVQFAGDRLTVSIKSIQYQGNIYPVNLTVYSLDGLPGIEAPTSVARDVAKQSADASLQSMGLTSFDPSIGAQATAAGIQAAKSLFSKKVRLITVTLEAGYQVLLKDNTSH